MGWNDMARGNQKRFNVTFRDNEKEIELYKWVKEKGDIGGISSFVKNVLYEKMKQEKEEKWISSYFFCIFRC